MKPSARPCRGFPPPHLHLHHGRFLCRCRFPLYQKAAPKHGSFPLIRGTWNQAGICPKTITNIDNLCKVFSSVKNAGGPLRQSEYDRQKPESRESVVALATVLPAARLGDRRGIRRSEDRISPPNRADLRFRRHQKEFALVTHDGRDVSERYDIRLLLLRGRTNSERRRIERVPGRVANVGITRRQRGPFRPRNAWTQSEVPRGISLRARPRDLGRGTFDWGV